MTPLPQSNADSWGSTVNAECEEKIKLVEKKIKLAKLCDRLNQLYAELSTPGTDLFCGDKSILPLSNQEKEGIILEKPSGTGSA